MAEPNYGNLVKTLKFQKGRGGANTKELVFVSSEEMANFDLNFIVGVHDTEGDWAPNHGSYDHPFDEVLLFFGYDPQDMNYLGSDMNLAIGKEQEQHTFNVPTVVSIPRGLVHFPITGNKVDKPYRMMQVGLGLQYKSQ